jgi:hypothetical protein
VAVDGRIRSLQLIKVVTRGRDQSIGFPCKLLVAISCNQEQGIDQEDTWSDILIQRNARHLKLCQGDPQHCIGVPHARVPAMADGSKIGIWKERSSCLCGLERSHAFHPATVQSEFGRCLQGDGVMRPRKVKRTRKGSRTLTLHERNQEVQAGKHWSEEFDK